MIEPFFERSHLRHHAHIDHSTFGGDAFGRFAERFARFLGSATFIIAQTAMVIVWVTLNFMAVSLRWDPYPFILLNLAFSTQAAYAAPLILLAQTRQTERDKDAMEADVEHREQVAADHASALDLIENLLVENTALTQEIHNLMAQMASKG